MQVVPLFHFYKDGELVESFPTRDKAKILETIYKHLDVNQTIEEWSDLHGLKWDAAVASSAELLDLAILRDCLAYSVLVLCDCFELLNLTGERIYDDVHRPPPIQLPGWISRLLDVA